MDTITFAEFDDQQRVSWLASTLDAYTQERTLAGDSPDQARAAADRARELFFPDGSPAPGHLAGHVLDASDVVGTLWIGPRETGSDDWWVWDIEILPERRGQGLGRQAMLLAEQMAKEKGAATLGLNVFGHNTVARSLYESLGYEPLAIQMRKDLAERT